MSKHEYDVGEFVDLSHIGKVRSAAVVATKSDDIYSYDYLFRAIKGRIFTARITPGCVPVFVG